MPLPGSVVQHSSSRFSGRLITGFYRRLRILFARFTFICWTSLSIRFAQHIV